MSVRLFSVARFVLALATPCVVAAISQSSQPRFLDPYSELKSQQQQVYSLADLMFGARSHYELNNYSVAHLRQRMYFGYVQDDFKMSDRLTLNLGIRYEFATPQWDEF